MADTAPGKTAVWRERLGVLFDRYEVQGAALLGTAMLVGLSAGLGAVFFRWLIREVSWLAFDELPRLTHGLGGTYLVLAPLLGGLLVGPLVYFFAREAKGHGVPEVMEAIALRGGRIRPVVALVKALASSLCIGSGGSVGREGPIVQIGSALGSSIGQFLNLSGDRVRNLVACGAAGGIAATFNAPIAGVFFALEVILADFGATAFGTVVVSSVTASVVGRAAFGDRAAFAVTHYAIASLWEFPLYLLLGGLAAVVAVVYTRSIYRAEDLFDEWNRVPPWIKPAIGGALLGLIALAYGLVPGLGFDRVPQVYGVGYETIEAGLRGQQELFVMLSLMVLKIGATALTLGSGGSGGVFAPSLFVGSMLGGGFGRLLHLLFPGLQSSPGGYALVGMGAVFAAASHAPMTAVIMMFEMTGDYNIILPLMFTVVTATLLSRVMLHGESIYTLKLSRRGVRLRQGRVVDVLERVHVEEVMTRQPTTVTPEDSLEQLQRLFLRTNRHAFPVVDAAGRLCGIVSLTDLRRAADEAAEHERPVASLMTREVITAYPDETLDAVLQRMAPRDLSRLPVVARVDPGRLLGVVRRNDVVRAYNLALMRSRGEESPAR